MRQVLNLILIRFNNIDFMHNQISTRRLSHLIGLSLAASFPLCLHAGEADLAACKAFHPAFSKIAIKSDYVLATTISGSSVLVHSCLYKDNILEVSSVRHSTSPSSASPEFRLVGNCTKTSGPTYSSGRIAPSDAYKIWISSARRMNC